MNPKYRKAYFLLFLLLVPVILLSIWIKDPWITLMIFTLYSVLIFYVMLRIPKYMKEGESETARKKKPDRVKAVLSELVKDPRFRMLAFILGFLVFGVWLITYLSFETVAVLIFCVAAVYYYLQKAKR